MLPPAVQNFLDLSSDPDFDGYQADTSINTNDSNDSTRSSTPIMTLSDDFLLDPSNWTSDPLRAHLMRLRDLIQQDRSTPTIPTSTLPIDDPSSVTELESEPKNPPQPAIPTPTLPVDDPSSMTEPESEPKRSAPTKPTPTLPVDDPSSVTEPESEPENPPQPEFSMPIKIKGATPVSKKKGFFDTPSPPGPNSLYWKYISCEEDDRWYDRSKTDDSFDAVRQMKQQLRDIT
ncbi:hypothetical protein EV424DRAFT_1537493 [Suillus variegatus]|nr:hypothetical protein EV424DRAFT_1537493 [Suillus variegatus]